MKTSDEYRQYAAECLRLADRAKTAEERKILRDMAATWQNLAERAGDGEVEE